MIALAILWILSPLGLIPAVIVLGIQNRNLKKSAETECLQSYNAMQKPQSQQVMQTPPQQTAPVSQQPAMTVSSQPAMQMPPQQAVSIPQQSAYTQPLPQLSQPVQYPTQVIATRAKKERNKISTMNLMFFIGVLFVIVAGIIFATTTWSILPNIAKVLIILLLVMFFFAVSVFSNQKLHLPQTSLTFYLLGSLFIPVSLLGMGYFKMLGQYLSLTGDGRFLIGLLASVLLVFASLYGAKCYRSHLFVWLSYITETAAVFFLFWQISSDKELRCLLLALYCTLVMLIKGRVSSVPIEESESTFLKRKVVLIYSRYADIVFYIVGFVSLVIGIFESSFLLTLTLLCILFSMSWAIVVYEQRWMCRIHPFVTLIMLFEVHRLKILGDYNTFVFEALCFIAFFLYRQVKFKKIALFRSAISDTIFIGACAIASFTFFSTAWFSGTHNVFLQTAPIFSTLYILIMLGVLAFQNKTDAIGKISAYLMPWDALYILYWINKLSEESFMSQLFLIFFIFFMLLTMLLILCTKKTSVLRRLEHPFSIMLIITGTIACIYEATISETHFEPVYFWLFTLYAIIKLYEKLLVHTEMKHALDMEASVQTAVVTNAQTAGATNAKTASVTGTQRVSIESIHRWSRAWFYIMIFCATLASVTTINAIVPTIQTEHKLLFLLFVTLLLLVTEVFLTPLQRLIRVLEKDVRLSLNVLGHIYFILLFFTWYVKESPELEIGVLLIVATAVFQLILYRQKNTIAGFVSILPMQLIVNELLVQADFHIHMHNSVLVGEMFILLILGRLLFKNVVKTELKTDERAATHLIDWIGIYAVFAPMILLFSSNVMWIFAAKILLVVYTLNFFKRTKVNADKVVLTVAIGLLCFATATQPFCQIPTLIANEVKMLIALLFIAILYKFIWKGYEKYLAKIFYILLILCFLVQFVECLPGINHFDILIFSIGVIIVAVTSIIKKSRCYSILAQVLLLLGITIIGNIERPSVTDVMVHINYISVIVCAVLCHLSLYRRRRLWAGVIPVSVLLALYQKWIVLFDFTVDVSMFAWLLLFLSMLAVGYFLHREKAIAVTKEEAVVDWYSLLNVVPVVILLIQQNEMWHFCGLILLILYVMSFYRRIHENADKPILTFAAFILCIAWWTQPFFEIPQLFCSEWNMVAWILFSLFLYQGVWKEYKRVFSWLFCIVIAICMLWQGYEAISDKELADVMVLGLSALIILLVSFWIKSKRWFLIAAITLVTVIIYLSRDFWLSLAWWIYLLATGIILISVASVNEYYKKKGEASGEKLKRMMQEWKW